MRLEFVNLVFRGFDRLVREGNLWKLEKRVGDLGCAVVVDQVAPYKVWWTEVPSIRCNWCHLQLLFTLGIRYRRYLNELVL